MFPSVVFQDFVVKLGSAFILYKSILSSFFMSHLTYKVQIQHFESTSFIMSALFVMK